MNQVIAFLRNIDKRRLVYLFRRILSLWLPRQPYEACRNATRCPCPKAQPTAVTGVAIGANTACVKVG